MVAVPVALTIAGSDSGGGAGIQADLKTFAFLKVHGTSALTCITAQNTLGVSQVLALPPDLVVAQMEAVLGDLGVSALKTGMLFNQGIMEAVGDTLSRHAHVPWVLDPVMVSRSGDPLLEEAAIDFLKTHLLPRATLITPNRYEAQLLTGVEVVDLPTQEAAARKLLALGARAGVVKGGGLASPHRAVDLWWEGETLAVLRTECVATPHTHGTGCTLSAAIAAHLALGHGLLESVQQAKAYVTQALKYALPLGQGQGPVGHFFPLLT